MKNIKSSKGFTLVETMVAISILSLTVAATFTAVQLGLKASIGAKDQITAFYLAQEALEFIKNVRDENALHSLQNPSSVNWLHNISETKDDPCWMGDVNFPQKTCTIDSAVGISGGVVACSGGFGTCPNLSQDSSTGLYGYTAGGNWRATNFKREIQISMLPTVTDAITVTIKMSWETEGVPKTFTITGSVYNRQ